MSGHEVMVERITIIISELYQHGFVSRQKLKDEFRISERTLYRDLNRLGDRIVHDGNGIYRLAPAYAKKQSFEELRNLARTLGVEELIPMSKSMLQTDMTSLSIRSLPGDPEAQRVLENNFSLFDKAIRENSICQFHYKDKIRTVAPYKLINIKGVWYLGAVEEKNVKGYQLSNIRWLTLTSVHFNPESHITRYFAEEDDVWFSLHKQIVHIKVAANVSYYFQRRNVLSAQKLIRQEPNGDLIVQTEMAHENQLFPLLRYWLPNLIIIHPITLQQRFQQTLRQQMSEMEVSCSGNIFDDIQQE